MHGASSPPPFLFAGVNGTNFPLDVCWASFVRSSIERWMYLFVLMANWGVPNNFVQYFHDQLNAFVQAFAPEATSFSLKSIVCIE